MIYYMLLERKLVRGDVNFFVSWHRNDLLDFLSFHRQTKVFLKYWHADKLADQLLKAQEAVITIQKGTFTGKRHKRDAVFL